MEVKAVKQLDDQFFFATLDKPGTKWTAQYHVFADILANSKTLMGKLLSERPDNILSLRRRASTSRSKVRTHYASTFLGLRFHSG